MSTIAIVVTKTSDWVKTAAVLRRVAPGTSVTELKQRMESGEPVVAAPLFGNDYPEVAERLRTLVRDLPLAGAELRFFELEPGEKFDSRADLVRWEITSDTLLNILSSDSSYQ